MRKKFNLMLLIIFCLFFFNIRVSAAENTENIVVPQNIFYNYQSYIYGRYSGYISMQEKYWRSDAFSVIWDNGWKGYVLDNNSTRALIGVVLYNDSIQPVNIDFENYYYQLAYNDGGKNNPNFVRAVQMVLNDLGYNAGPVDGEFGPMTDAAVQAFQSNHGLVVDGIVGKATYKELSKAIN